MVLVWHDGVENNDSLYQVTKEDLARLAEDLQNNAEVDDLPKISLKMLTPEEWAEAERIGNELA